MGGFIDSDHQKETRVKNAVVDTRHALDTQTKYIRLEVIIQF